MASADDLEVLAGTLRERARRACRRGRSAGRLQRRIRRSSTGAPGCSTRRAARSSPARRRARVRARPARAAARRPRRRRGHGLRHRRRCGSSARGRLEPTDVAFAREAELRHAIERILAPLGRRVDEAEPLCDARLPDGSRVNVVLPPLALDGPLLTIRRFRRRGLGRRRAGRARDAGRRRCATCSRRAVARALQRCWSAAAPARARRRRSARWRRSSAPASAS